MQSQGELSALIHKMNELSKHSAHMGIADELSVQKKIQEQVKSPSCSSRSIKV